jgi:hypothetical protein
MSLSGISIAFSFVQVLSLDERDHVPSRRVAFLRRNILGAALDWITLFLGDASTSLDASALRNLLGGVTAQYLVFYLTDDRDEQFYGLG